MDRCFVAVLIVAVGLWLTLSPAQVNAEARAQAGATAQGRASGPATWTAAELFNFNKGSRPLQIGALPADIESPSAAECETCHVAEAAEWRGSLHRRSWTQPLFLSAFALEPMPECRNCHQPLTADRDAQKKGEGRAAKKALIELRAEGVNCVTCHVRDGAVLSGARSGRAPHQVTAAPIFKSAEFCGGCHQFPFPDRRGDGIVHHTSEPMQDTVEEWRRVSTAGVTQQTCQGCHMPWVPSAQDSAGPGAGSGLDIGLGIEKKGHRSHRFLGGYDGGMLARAVDVSATLGPLLPSGAKAKGSRLLLTLSARDVGHAVPTGDLYRSLLIEVVPTDLAGKSIPGQKPLIQKLTRSFITVIERDEDGKQRVRRKQAGDERLLPGEPRSLEFTLPPVAAARYRLSLHRLPPGMKAEAGTAPISLVKEGLVRMTESNHAGQGTGTSTSIDPGPGTDLGRGPGKGEQR